METPIGWGILGTGRIASDFATAVKACGEAGHLVAVGSRRGDSANDFASRHGIATAYGSYEELVNDPEVQVVYVSSPHPFHLENALLALNAKKHVLCEKVICMNAKQCEELIEAAHRNGCYLMEAMWTRFFPLVQELRSRVGSGEFGRILSLRGSFGFKDDQSNDRISEPALGGGSLLDIGIYLASFTSMLLGPAAPDHIAAKAVLSEKGVDEEVHFALRYGEVTSQLHSSIREELPCEFEITTERARILVHRPFWCPTKVTIASSTAPTAELEVLERPLPAVPDGESYYFVNSQGLAFEARAVVQDLAAKRLSSTVMPLEETLTIMHTLDAVRERIGLCYPMD